MKTFARYLPFVALLVTSLHADSWSFPRELDRKAYPFGESRIVLEIDARKDTQYPDFILSIYLGEEMMAKYRNVGFEDLFPSPDNEYFLGLSNSGLPGTAFVIFDKRGRLIREEKHQFVDPSIHTSMSVTLHREWFDKKHPDVQWEFHMQRLGRIWVNGSSGNRYDLLDRTLGLGWHPGSGAGPPRATSKPS